jgi:MFS family permease
MAICAAALGYGVMSFIMTATPISMHLHAGHSLESTKLVIQSHIAAMYLPSLIYASMFSRLGFKGMLWSGVLVFAICIVVALINTQFIHYWLALILLGIGWNFLFLSGTNLLPYGYEHRERFRVQSSNDFLVFSIQAIASLSSGWVLYQWGWTGLLWACVPMVVAFALLLLFTQALKRKL